MKVLSIVALGLSAAAVGTVLAQTRPPTFSQLDTDRNGYISVDEAASDASLLKWFKRLDRDGDGQLSREEYAAFEQVD